MTMCMACGGRRHAVMPSCARQHPEATHCTCPDGPPPDRPTLILAPTYARAVHWAQANDVPRQSLIWITEPRRLLGFNHTARLVVMDGWWQSVSRENYHDIVQRLTILRASGIEEINPS